VSESNANYSGLIILTHLQFIAGKVMEPMYWNINFTVYGVEGFRFITYCILICSSYLDWYFTFFFSGSENGKPCSQDIKFWCFCTNHSKFPRKIFKGSRMHWFRQTKGWSISKGQLQYINNVMLFKLVTQRQGVNKWLYNKTVWPINYFNGRRRKDAWKVWLDVHIAILWGSLKLKWAIRIS